jgi:hypothetical protein
MEGINLPQIDVAGLAITGNLRLRGLGSGSGRITQAFGILNNPNLSQQVAVLWAQNFNTTQALVSISGNGSP